ncbi:efflux RND transporter periplasmic adaptor subunit [Marinicella rhabdoformis]|uniref:efflux RND transporter periplasmic adaptor subunit n=1 Tax=Marinicella rhabdoformis TaxID=2580566 RepID=UPI0012AEC3E6|nr:efflux RND transporter periplasmic adaptor subunit [Marinicella rhabdoformis]
MKKITSFMLLSIMLLTWVSESWAQEEAGSQPAAPTVPVVLDSVKNTEVVATMPITGNVYSRNDVQITAAVSGMLLTVAAPGTVVKQGDEIAKMDTKALELQHAEQQALIVRAKAQLKYLETNLKRQQDLVKAKSISANSVEQTESQRDVAASDLAVAKIRLEQTEEQLARSVINAPFDGMVSSRLRRVGETVGAGTVLASLTDMSRLEIRVQVPLQFVNHVKVGQELNVFAFGVQQQATVDSMVPNSQNISHAYEMRLAFENVNGLAIGQLVSVGIPMKAMKTSLVVNQDALVLRENGTFVFRVKADNTVEQIAVVANENVGELIAIDAPLEVGDQVVIRGADGLSNGATVESKS